MKGRTVNIQAQKFNKRSYTKDSLEHNFICQSGSHTGLPWSHAQTCMFSFLEEESSRQMTQRMQNSSYIGLCECMVRNIFFKLILSRHSVKVAYILYWGAQPICTLNISTDVLYTNCSCRGRMSDFLSFAVVDREWSSFAARLWRELSF